MAQTTCKENIAKAIQTEKVSTMHKCKVEPMSCQVISTAGEVSFSSSAPDTMEFLHYLVVFAKHLEWSNLEETYGFAITVVQVGHGEMR